MEWLQTGGWVLLLGVVFWWINRLTVGLVDLLAAKTKLTNAQAEALRRLPWPETGTRGDPTLN